MLCYCKYLVTLAYRYKSLFLELFGVVTVAGIHVLFEVLPSFVKKNSKRESVGIYHMT